MRAWCAQEFRDHGIEFTPLQANMGLSRLRGTIRGMHFQVAPALEAKLVRCTRGALFDVVVDLRPESPTYRRWYGAELTADNGRMLYVPEGCAHGFQTLQDGSEVFYQISAPYSKEHAAGVRWDDPAFGISWPYPDPLMSDRDRDYPDFRR